MCRARRRGLLAVLLALSLSAIALVPAADASRKSEKRQNAAIKRNAANIKKGAKALAGVAARVKALEDGAANLATKSALDGVSNRVKAIEDAAPQIVSGLQAAGEGLTKLKTLATSTEYGFGQVIVISAGPTPHPQAGAFVETPNVPDDVQQAQTQQTFKNGPDAGTVLVRYGVRSNENDGTGSTNPAALCKVAVSSGAQYDQTAANANIGGLPFQPVNNKSAVTSTDPLNAGFPFGLKTNGADADQTQDFTSTVALAAGDLYTVTMSCVDTSPDASDPSA